MIKSISVVNFRGESMVMELSKPETTGLIVKEISGIGSGQADINLSEMATTDGGKYNSSRLSTRNIVITLQFLMTPSVEVNRRKSYRFFPTKKNVTLKFHTDGGIRQIEGYVESNEPNIFSKEEDTQISIICPDPYFYDANYTNMVLSGYEAMFEFPFSNESLTEDLIIFDNLKYDKRISFVYEGEADTGTILYIHSNGEAKNIRIANIETGTEMNINTDKFPSVIGNKIQASDIIEISTYLGNRSAFLIRDGIRYNIINSLGRHSDWFILQAGINTFVYTASVGENLLDVSLRYKNVYEGV